MIVNKLKDKWFKVNDKVAQVVGSRLK
ncbi:hypothetical protein DESC_690036 [Desulfosarcina cetonica]|nr:hypothetical protein DESC_690036 [Desulfosarcina cetonica]